MLKDQLVTDLTIGIAVSIVTLYTDNIDTAYTASPLTRGLCYPVFR